ncbi:segregation and condensation protein A [Desulfonema limicola]|nr:segregation/condensation protein A [Desulfonema limicola]
MDLLVFLIKKNEVDIYDIPIALITEQYLQYLDWMKAMNIDFAGDFILMASTLTHIKSRMLLPVHHDSDEEDEDPRMEIARPLLEYLRMKSAAEQLADRDFLGEDTFSRVPSQEDLKFDNSEQSIQVSMFELIKAFQNILENISKDHLVDFSRDRFSIKDKISAIIDILEQKGSIVFHELFSRNTDKDELIVTFLAVLELGKLGLVRIAQQFQTGIIRLFYL